ncbi:MAG TPA: hypothetical protein VF121_08110 [Thermoanaerobaculia bacterium]|nr:hypothetical protein [Thermoanaerobaculia bacterium]
MVLPADRPLTYDDLLALPEDGLRHELIDGEHVVSPSPNTKHQRVSGNLYFAGPSCATTRSARSEREEEHLPLVLLWPGCPSRRAGSRRLPARQTAPSSLR